ncbi:DUF1178 family protein [Mesobacterium pallidum]|uniref:DUF1178 family protein n=1 Tax=Mesobacterium pallidum TaxID=2872037 RepID=UPI001EE348B5|nr:DUF1178 family protein [Mesobacterium pallidum]
MIHYDLKCSDGHRFDSWFQSASAYDKLHAAGMVACATCGSTEVEKMMMAPGVRTSRKAAADPAPAPAASPGQPPAGMAEMIAKLRDTVEKNATYVGGGFAKEARAQHLGEAPERPIYGEAKPEEARALIEDGVTIAPLPFTPRQKTN